jgi:sulfate/thiosulfate transport system permease protein
MRNRQGSAGSTPVRQEQPTKYPVDLEGKLSVSINMSSNKESERFMPSIALPSRLARSSTTPFRVLPGFHLSLGFTLFYLALIVLLPLSAIFLKTFTMSWDGFWTRVTSPRVLASYRLTFGASLLAAALNAVLGGIVAWVLVRYRFPGKKIVDALVDLPFALPTAVAGIALTALYAPNGWLGRYLEPLGLKIAFTPLGVLIALTFIGLPFVVRTVQPVLEDAERELEEAAASLGATHWQTFVRVVFPAVLPALLTGFALAFARAAGEYGSVIFIAGNMPMISEITPLLIITKLEQYDYAGATALAVVMLLASFLMLLAINLLQAWARSRRSRVSLT